MLVVRSITHMIINQQIRIHRLNQPHQSPGLQGIDLHKVPIQIQVLAIPPRSKFFRPVLVHPRKGTALPHSADVKHRNHHQDRIRGQRTHSCQNIADQHHAGIYSVRLPRVNAVIDQNHQLSLAFPCRWIQITFQRNNGRMQGKSSVGHPSNSRPSHFLGIGRSQIRIILDNFLVRRRFRSTRRFKNGGETKSLFTIDQRDLPRNQYHQGQKKGLSPMHSCHIIEDNTFPISKFCPTR